MNSVSYVDNLISQLKNSGVPLDVVAWKAALACIGWPYVYGAVGEECKPAKRAQYGTKFYPKDHTTIVTKCKAISWNAGSQTCKVTGNCSGCKWNLPVRMFDCRGFTRKILQMVYGWTLMGGTVGGQWNDAKNWKAKGEIADGIPADTLVCLFVYNSSKKNWQHTGFGFNDETCECSSGVQHFTTRNKKWTHWGIPACEGIVPPPPEPIPKGYAKVIGKNVALRKDPSLQATIIMRIKTGETVKLEPLPPKEWGYVSFGGKKGWMMREFLREEGDHAIVTWKNVALRKDPSLRATIIMRIRTGLTVNLEPEPESQWDYVSYQGKIGYMMKEFLKEG